MQREPPAAHRQQPLRQLFTQHVSLTFDDGPDATWTPAVLDVLAAADTRATFFVIGSAARAHPGLLRRMVEAGHEVANHGFSHRHPWLLSEAQVVRDFVDGQTAIADITGEAPRWFRPPHGRLRSGLLAHLHSAQQYQDVGIALWSVSAVDWGLMGTAAGIKRRLDAVQSGDIVLMHDAPRTSNHPEQLLLVLPGFLQQLAAAGLPCSLLPTVSVVRQPIQVRAHDTGNHRYHHWL